MLVKGLVAASLLVSSAAMAGVANAQQSGSAQAAAYIERSDSGAATVCTYQGGPKSDTWTCR